MVDHSKMKELSLGKKIRQLRIDKKITQQELVGDFITRNMLSQIESGAASPSLKTLEYLANTLEIPIQYLVSDGGAEPLRSYSPIPITADILKEDIDEKVTTPELYGLILSLKALYDAKQFDKLGEVLNEMLNQTATHK